MPRNKFEEQERSNGRFASDDPALTKLTVRVSHAVRSQVERAAQGRVADWLREAIAEKLEKKDSEKAY